MEEDGPSAQLKREAHEQDLKDQTSRPTNIAKVRPQSSTIQENESLRKRRPPWEPPIFDYTHLAQLLEAQKEMMATRRGDLEWQFDAMNLELEWRLLQMYRTWARNEHHCTAEFGSGKEEEFLKNLEMDINEDLSAVFEEQQGFDEKWGKEVGEWFDLYDKIHRRIK